MINFLFFFFLPFQMARLNALLEVKSVDTGLKTLVLSKIIKNLIENENISATDLKQYIMDMTRSLELKFDDLNQPTQNNLNRFFSAHGREEIINELKKNQ